MAGKTDIVDHVTSQKDDLTKKDAGEFFDAVIEAMTHFLERGDRVTLPGFGSFTVRQRKARTGRNPKTGETMRIPASKNVGFRAGKNLKEAVN